MAHQCGLVAEEWGSAAAFFIGVCPRGDLGGSGTMPSLTSPSRIKITFVQENQVMNSCSTRKYLQCGSTRKSSYKEVCRISDKFVV